MSTTFRKQFDFLSCKTHSVVFYINQTNRNSHLFIIFMCKFNKTHVLWSSMIFSTFIRFAYTKGMQPQKGEMKDHLAIGSSQVNIHSIQKARGFRQVEPRTTQPPGALLGFCWYSLNMQSMNFIAMQPLIIYCLTL